MNRACVALAILCGAAGPALADEKLVYLIPNLYGPAGLVVDSEARLPSGETHSAHFNSAFQAEFVQFNISLASQLASVPLPSPASGFTYTLNPALGVFERSTQSFGPILAERAETIGRGKFSFGFNYQRFSFDTLEGVDLGNVGATFTHDSPSPGGRADVVTTANSIDLTVGQFTTFLTYGITDRLDVSLAVPVVDVELGVRSVATVQRIGTAGSPATHFFRGPDGNFGDSREFAETGAATGLGDLVLRTKLTALKRESLGVAIGLDARVPTGDEEDLLGSGAFGLRPALAVSWSHRVFSPHVNLAYQWNGKSLLAGNVLLGQKRTLPGQVSVEAGIDIGVTNTLTLAFDVLGRRVLDSPRLVSETFTALDGQSQFPDVRFEDGADIDIWSGAVGIKFNVGGRLLLDANVLVKLNEGGLRDKVTPLLGLEYSF